jgi:hypothetical protein
MPNDNVTFATITPPKGAVAKSASRHTSKGTSTGPGPDSPSNLKDKKKKLPKLDARLEPIRQLIESQPSAIQVTLSETAIALLLATQTLRHKRAGILSLEMNDDLYPKPANLKTKLAVPKELENDEKTLSNIKEWDDFIVATKEVMKKKIIQQSIRTADFLNESRHELFHNQLVTIAEGYTTYEREIEHATDEPLSSQAYGAAAVYCYFSTLPATHQLFMNYLNEEQEDLMKAFKKSYMQTANGQYYFSVEQIHTLASLIGPGDVTIDLLTQNGPPTSPSREETKDDDSEATETHGPPPAPATQRNNVAMGQRSQTQAQNEVEYIPPAGRTLSPGITKVIQKVQTTLSELVPKLFLDLIATTEERTLLLRANAKLEASLKKSQTIDMSKEIQESFAHEPTVAPESMKTLMRGLLKEELTVQRKQTEKQLMKAALQTA